MLDMARLRGALGAETVAMMARHEAEGTTAHAEYQAAVTSSNAAMSAGSPNGRPPSALP